jgi:hypothetical protein
MVLITPLETSVDYISTTIQIRYQGWGLPCGLDPHTHIIFTRHTIHPSHTITVTPDSDSFCVTSDEDVAFVHPSTTLVLIHLRVTLSTDLKKKTHC